MTFEYISHDVRFIDIRISFSLTAESDASQNSDNSTRSTSSSFLKFQSRPKWRSLLHRKTVVRRKEDGSELPLEHSKAKWPLFSQIYKRQNQLTRGDDDGDEEESEEDIGEEEFESELAPPAPVFQLELDCDDESPSLVDVTTQESGTSTCERSEKEKVLPSVGTAKTSSFETCATEEEAAPIPAPAQCVKDNKNIATVPGKDSNRQKRNKQTNDILTPLSIPLTICYSLRSAIGDGSARQRNSHALMERRSLRPNGSHLNCSHWSHRGKRSYMEGMYKLHHVFPSGYASQISRLPLHL